MNLEDRPRYSSSKSAAGPERPERRDEIVESRIFIADSQIFQKRFFHIPYLYTPINIFRVTPGTLQTTNWHIPITTALLARNLLRAIANT
jgi:hypothetical protein